MVLDRKSSQESFSRLYSWSNTFSVCYTLMTLMMLSVILLSMLMIPLSAPVWLPSELESDLWDTVDWGSKWLIDFSAWKIYWFLSPEVDLHLYNFTIWPCLEYCNVWAGASSCYLEMLDMLQNHIGLLVLLLLLLMNT